MARYQIIEVATGRKVNVAEWDGVSAWSPGDGLIAQLDDGLGIPATKEKVTAECDRRIDASFIFNGVSYQCRANDRENIAGAAQLAFMAKDGGQPFSLQWIAEDNSVVTMDADAVIAFASAAAMKKSALIFAARALKDRIEAGEVIADCADAQYWP